MREPRRMALVLSALWLGMAGVGSASAAGAAAPGAKPAHAAKPAPNARPATKAKIATRAKPAAKAKPVQARPPETVAEMAAWVRASDDNGGLPFAIIDKAAAQVFVFGSDGRLRGGAPALLGSALGDDSAPGIGDRELSAIRPDERTTPAGRFMAGFGSASGNQKVFWVDYGTAISLHPVITSNPKEQRLKRLRSPSPADNRITYGCINVSAPFYEKVIRGAFTGTKGVVYVLPEMRPIAEVFPSFWAQAQASSAPTGDHAQALDAGPGPAADTSETAISAVAR